MKGTFPNSSLSLLPSLVKISVVVFVIIIEIIIMVIHLQGMHALRMV